jgi:hypothetical protein
VSFDLSAFQASDQAEMVVRHPVTNEPTTWKITFAGPGHPKTRELADRLARQSLREEQEQARARVNGRKWKGEERSPNEARDANFRAVADRIIQWSPVRLNGEDVPFNTDNAMRLLSDPAMGTLFAQCLEFLGAEASFLQDSAKNSSPSQSTSSDSPS